MSFRLLPDETLPMGLKRVLREELSSAMESLHSARSAREGSAERDLGIHGTRKSVKKVRSLVRALEPRLGHMAEQENAALQAVGQALSQARDAVAATEIIDVLVERYSGRPGVRSLGATRRKLRSQAAGNVMDLDPLY